MESKGKNNLFNFDKKIKESEIEKFNKTSLYNIEYYKTDKWKTDSEEEMKRVYSRLEHILRR